MSRGKFITLEGGEGVGKSTQARLLTDALQRRGIAVLATREPGGTDGAERIRTLLLSNEGEGWKARAEALLFAAARSDHVERLIEPALARGQWVICDRFIDSSRAYQGGGGGLDDAGIMVLHAIGSSGLLPDLTVLLEVSPDVASQRLAGRDGDAADRIAGRDARYHARVTAAFAGLAEREPGRFARVDGNRDPEQTHALVMAALGRLLDDAA
jgi:dTMP kinase